VGKKAQSLTSRFPFTNIKVNCLSGYRSDERPVSFSLKDRLLNVLEVVDGWKGEDHEYFKVRTDDGFVYILRHSLEDDCWDIAVGGGGGRV
jgi:hypothetical protein